MNAKYLLPVLAALLMSGCAATSNDPVRQRVVAELKQAQAQGLSLTSEAQYTYPWPELRTSARTASNSGVTR